ncbi:MAG: hypothetical protein IJO52_05660 [Clostridia bacterium]|nr:hypothetical protein [Clostridia bacterium]
MKKISKISLVLLSFVFILTLFTTMVSAKTYTGTKYGYKSDYIYVHTNKANAKIPLTFTKGMLNSAEITYSYNCPGYKEKSMYASYEVKISYWNGNNYVLESNYDIYNKASHTLTLKRKNTDYRIQIYQWRTETTLRSYINKNLFPFKWTQNILDTPFWRTLPKFSTGTLKYCTFK